MLSAIRRSTRLPPRPTPALTQTQHLPSAYPVSDLASASIAAAGEAVAHFISARHKTAPSVTVNQRLASLWFHSTLRPMGWSLPPLWDPIAGDYITKDDAWIRLHTNAPHHRAAALSTLDVPNTQTTTPEDVAAAVATWNATELETAVIAANGCAGELRSSSSWAKHPQGIAVAKEPLVHSELFPGPLPAEWSVDPTRPLHNIRVLDLTRVLAGPTATRFLAGYGADVLRIDPPSDLWVEALAEEMTLGKRSAIVDLRTDTGKDTLQSLIAQADVVIHGYRGDALERLGIGPSVRRSLNPGLVDVTLCAYGWTGPWAHRRGFDSIVQMSTGIAETGMRVYGKHKPTPLPVQALDFATGFIVAAAAISGLAERVRSGHGSHFRTSLARTAVLLESQRPNHHQHRDFPPETEEDIDPRIEETFWGPARRLFSPLTISNTPVYWDTPAAPIGTSLPHWREANN